MRKLLEQVQRAYDLRDGNAIESFFNSTFVSDANVSVLGTSLGELCLGISDVKEIFTDDWEGWGDLKIDCDPHYFKEYGNTAWFKTSGTVKYDFSYTDERKNNYVEFIKNTLGDAELSSYQKLALTNLGLSLTFFRRKEDERSELWPIGLSGVLKSVENEWKIHSLHFSHQAPDFPDLRLEDSKGLIEEESKPLDSPNTEKVLRSLTKESFFELLPLHSLEQYKCSGNVVYECEVNDNTWIIFEGKISLEDTDESMMNQVIEKAMDIVESDKNDEDKVSEVQRLLSYLMKALNSGNTYSYPIRLTALLSEEGVLESDISFPFYWIFEGKLK